ncbi:MAG TPA: hypothetical protein VLG76_08515 [Rhabdochlamydiaceae bacterium]|nr:hypothetical protein [Rhabdochlamydiaceae bacterium]
MISSILHLVYPALCIYCKELLISHQKLLCPKCTDLLTLLDAEQRCSKCFKESLLKVCKECQKRPSHYLKLGACFEHFGPAAALTSEFTHRLYLDQSLSSWLVVQMDKMAFPLPDLIVPFPHTFADKVLEGYNRAHLLAKRVGELYQCPVKDLLGRTEDHQFYWRCTADISDQIVLLVVETINEVETIAQCTEVIQEGFPKAIYVIAFTLTAL